MKKTLSLILATLMLLSVFSVAAFAVEAPVLKSLKSTFDGMIITWSAVEDAVNYVVYRADGEGEDAVIATTTKTKYVDKTVEDGVTYTYKVTVQVADGSFTSPETANSLTDVYSKPICEHKGAKWIVETEATVYASGEKQKVCPTCKEVLGTKVIAQLTPAVPDVKKLENGKLGVNLEWDAVDGATGYAVFRRQVGKKWKNIATVTKTKFSDRTVKSGVEYQYAVESCNAAGLSSYEKGNVIKFLAQPQNLKLRNIKDAVKISWDKVKGAKSYKIYCKFEGENKWVFVANTKKTSYLDYAVWSGGKFTYTVKAVSGKYSSKRDSVGKDIFFLSVPELAAAKSTKAGIKFTWNPVDGAAGYTVYRKTGKGAWEVLGKVNTTRSTAYLDKSAEKGVTYTYTVRARNDNSLSAYNKKGISCKDLY